VEVKLHHDVTAKLVVNVKAKGGEDKAAKLLPKKARARARQRSNPFNQCPTRLRAKRLASPEITPGSTSRGRKVIHRILTGYSHKARMRRRECCRLS
jgi:hypothetical protein